jgi:hypothetical protein
MSSFTVRWTYDSANIKTGNIPQGIIGRNKAETHASCKGCPLLRKRTPEEKARGEKSCYAHNGQVAFAAISVSERKRNPSLREIIRRRRKTPAVRLGMIGDPARAHRGRLRKLLAFVRSKGIKVLSYSHFWRTTNDPWARTAWMASCGNLAEADEALASGWRPCAIVPADTATATVETPDGNKLAVCLAQRIDGMTCAECGLCDASNPYWTRQISIVGTALKMHR